MEAGEYRLLGPLLLRILNLDLKRSRFIFDREFLGSDSLTPKIGFIDK